MLPGLPAVPSAPDAQVAEDFAVQGRRLTGAEQITKFGYPTQWRGLLEAGNRP